MIIQTHAQKLNETCLNLSKGIPPHLPSNKPCSLVGGPMSHHFAGISEMMSLHCKISLFLDSKSLLVHAQCPVELFCRSICKRKAKEAWGNFNSIAFVCLSVTFPSQFGEVFFFRDFRGGASLKAITYRLTLRTFWGGPVWHLEILGGGQSGYSNFFWKNLVTGRHLEILGGGELKKTPCIFHQNWTWEWPPTPPFEQC